MNKEMNMKVCFRLKDTGESSILEMKEIPRVGDYMCLFCIPEPVVTEVLWLASPSFFKSSLKNVEGIPKEFFSCDVCITLEKRT
jgi:hypothetical protein